MRLSDLTLILEGIDLASVRRRPRWRRASDRYNVRIRLLRKKSLCQQNQITVSSV